MALKKTISLERYQEILKFINKHPEMKEAFEAANTFSSMTEK